MLQSFFRHPTPPLIGLDISTTSVKLLELSKRGGRYHVDRYATAPIKRPSQRDADPAAQVEAVGDAVAKAVRRSRTRLKHAAVAVSGSAAITRTIPMPRKFSDWEIENRILLDAEQHIPYSLNEVYLDFQVMGPNANNPDTVNVLLAASRSETVLDRVAAVEAAGLSANVVDIEAYALGSCVEMLRPSLGLDEAATIAAVNIGHLHTTLDIFHGPHTLFMREQLFGGRQLVAEIQQTYGMSYEDATRAQAEHTLPEDYPQRVLRPFSEAVVHQVSRLLQVYHSTPEARTIDHLLLAGGTSRLEDLDRSMQAHLGVPVTRADPVQAMGCDGRINRQQLEQDSVSLLVACGLALRSFDHASR